MTKSSQQRIQRRLIKKHSKKALARTGLAQPSKAEPVVPYSAWVEDGMPRHQRFVLFSATRIDAQFLQGPDGLDRKARAVVALKESIRTYLDQIYNMIEGDELVTHELEVAESAGMMDLGGNLRLTEINADSGSSFYVELIAERVSPDELSEEETTGISPQEEAGGSELAD